MSLPPTSTDPVAAYVVLSHQAPPMVERLVSAIRRSSPNSWVFVAHDARTVGAPHVQDERVAVREHGVATDWGSWELVEATLDAMRWARSSVDPDLLVLVSGACYPVRPLAAWEREFLAGGGGWLGTAEPLRYRPRWGRRLGEGSDDLTRYVYHWFRVPRLGLPLPRAVRHWGVRVRRALALRLEPLFTVRFVARGRGLHLGLRKLRTPFDEDHPCYKGSQWVAVDRAALAYLTDELVPGNRVHDFFRGSIIPDEGLIQTALAWREPPQRQVASSHSVWDVELDTTLTWTSGDEDTLIASGSPFARKFDPAASRELMDRLDRVNGVADGC